MKKSRSSQKGVALLLVLFAVLGLAALAYSAMSSKGEGGSGLISGATVGAHATSVAAQANAIQDGYMLAAINAVAADSVTFDAAVGTGLMNPSVGAMQTLSPDENAFPAGGPVNPWTALKLKMPGMGTPTGFETVALLTGVRPDICLAIQKKGKGPSVVAVPAVTVAPVALADLSAEAGITGQLMGCFSNGGSNSVFAVVNSL